MVLGPSDIIWSNDLLSRSSRLKLLRWLCTDQLHCRCHARVTRTNTAEHPKTHDSM